MGVQLDSFFSANGKFNVIGLVKVGVQCEAKTEDRETWGGWRDGRQDFTYNLQHMLKYFISLTKFKYVFIQNKTLAVQETRRTNTRRGEGQQRRTPQGGSSNKKDHVSDLHQNLFFLFVSQKSNQIFNIRT